VPIATYQELSAPVMADLHIWLTAQVGKLSRGHDLTKACL
jgi:transposase